MPCLQLFVFTYLTHSDSRTHSVSALLCTLINHSPHDVDFIVCSLRYHLLHSLFQDGFIKRHWQDARVWQTAIASCWLDGSWRSTQEISFFFFFCASCCPDNGAGGKAGCRDPPGCDTSRVWGHGLNGCTGSWSSESSRDRLPLERVCRSPSRRTSGILYFLGSYKYVYIVERVLAGLAASKVAKKRAKCSMSVPIGIQTISTQFQTVWTAAACGADGLRNEWAQCRVRKFKNGENVQPSRTSRAALLGQIVPYLPPAVNKRTVYL